MFFPELRVRDNDANYFYKPLQIINQEITLNYQFVLLITCTTYQNLFKTQT